MQRLLRERATEAFAWLVPARHRATLAMLLPGGERRCDRQSRCGRQAAELIQLLLRHASEQDEPADDDDEALFQTQTQPQQQSPRRRKRRRGLLSLQQAECIALLDPPDRFLTTGGTCLLALATVREAFLQAQENTMPCDRDRMLGVIERLESLDQILRAMMAHHNSSSSSTTTTTTAQQQEEEEERCLQALLRHQGRGIELMQRQSQQPHRNFGA